MSAEIKVVGLGPGDEGLLATGTIKLLQDARQVYLRTGRHPAVAELTRQGLCFATFDDLYEKFDTFEEVYEEMAAVLLAAAHSLENGYIAFAVPGHPLVAEAAVEKLLQKYPGGVEIIPAMSFLDAMFARLKLDPIRGLKILDACSLRPDDVDVAADLLICQVYDRFIAADLKLKLMEHYPDEHRIKVIKAAGVAGEERIEDVALFELDRLSWIDHLTSVFIPRLSRHQVQNTYPLDPLVEVMQRLLAPDGCPWDREQDHESLKRYLIEETYEVVDAIESGDVHKLCEELGDLLLQIVFHAELARHQGSFDLNEIIAGVTRKMVRRHPHVFGQVRVSGSRQVLVNWEEIKAQEKKEQPGPESYLDDIPRYLPALTTAEKIQEKASRVGFDWPDLAGAWEKVKEEIAELASACDQANNERIKEELGDCLFALVNAARFLKVDPEDALRQTVNKFRRRFRHIEEIAAANRKKLTEMDLKEMDHLWEEAKIKEK